MYAFCKFRMNDLRTFSQNYNIRINSVGGAMEVYIKDALTGKFYGGESKRDKEYSKNFAWLGNQNNPPDAIAKGGDAFEIKKLQSPRNVIALNSSPPKDRLHSNDPRITGPCRESDGGNWKEKDIFYAVGWTQGQIAKSIYFVQGTCYAADRGVYDAVANRLSGSVKSAISESGLEAGDTTELGRINRVDPLGITALRVRGMWQIENPSVAFHNIAPLQPNLKFQAYAIMERGKLKKLLGEMEKEELQSACPEIKEKDVLIADPNNPANPKEASILEVSWK
jgi:hypothetical protein